jgi:hypothetical protein
MNTSATRKSRSGGLAALLVTFAALDADAKLAEAIALAQQRIVILERSR